MSLASARLLAATAILTILSACGSEAAETTDAIAATETAEAAPTGPLWSVGAEADSTTMTLTDGVSPEPLATLSCENGSSTITLEVPGFARIPEDSALTLSPDGGEPVLRVMVPAAGDGFASGTAPLPDDFISVFAGKHILAFGTNMIEVTNPGNAEADTFAVFCGAGVTE